jgi:hypothetical protein
MIELTQAQRQALEMGAPVVPTNTTYVLIRKDVYERIKGLLGDEKWAQDAYHASMEVFAGDGWDGPRMDVYDELKPRTQRVIHCRPAATIGPTLDSLARSARRRDFVAAPRAGRIAGTRRSRTASCQRALSRSRPQLANDSLIREDHSCLLRMSCAEKRASHQPQIM